MLGFCCGWFGVVSVFQAEAYNTDNIINIKLVFYSSVFQSVPSLRWKSQTNFPEHFSNFLIRYSVSKNLFSFYILVTVHLITTFVNNQHDAQFSFLTFVYSNSLDVSNNQVIIIRRINCINTTSGILVCRSMSVTVWYAGLDPSKSAYHTVTYIQWYIPEVVLIQLTLLMMSTWLLETCRELE